MLDGYYWWKLFIASMNQYIACDISYFVHLLTAGLHNMLHEWKVADDFYGVFNGNGDIYGGTIFMWLIGALGNERWYIYVVNLWNIQNCMDVNRIHSIALIVSVSDGIEMSA